MIVFDTNIVPEILKPRPNERVLLWFRQQPIKLSFISAISAAELYKGLALIPHGRRKTELEFLIGEMLEDFDERILPFSGTEARLFGQIFAGRYRLGRPVSHRDAMIAATALRHGATLVTRNIRDFDETGVDLFDPFAA